MPAIYGTTLFTITIKSLKFPDLVPAKVDTFNLNVGCINSAVNMLSGKVPNLSFEVRTGLPYKVINMPVFLGTPCLGANQPSINMTPATGFP